MDLYETYSQFQKREQNHAWDDTRRTRFDAFGCVIDTPTVEGFDPNEVQSYAQKRIAAQKRVQGEVRRVGVNDDARKLFNYKRKRGW